MKWNRSPILLACLLLPVATVSQAQTTSDQEAERYYLDEEIKDKNPRYGLGLGFGLVDLGDDLIVGQQLINEEDVEQYYTLGFRIGFGERRSAKRAQARGHRGYLEPEIAYWETDTQSDLLIGVNILGTTPVGGVEFFAGGGIGLHFLDTTIQQFSIDESEEALGVNAQFGVDIALSEQTSLFGMGRFDLIDGDYADDLQSKAVVGLRIRFGDDDDE